MDYSKTNFIRKEKSVKNCSPCGQVTDNKMKIFQSICEYYRNASIQPLSNSDGYYYKFRFYYWKYVMYIVLPFEASASAFAFFLFKAHSIVEYADAFFIFSSGLSCTIITASTIWKISSIFQLIKKFEEFIERSELTLPKNLFQNY